MTEESLKVFWEVGNDTPQLRVDNKLPEYREFIRQRQFKLIHGKHPEKFQNPPIAVDLDGFYYPIALLPGQVWLSQVHEVWDDDIISASYPKTGTTWIQEIVWLISNNFDFDTAKNVDLFVRSPIMEIAGLAGPVLQMQKRPRQYHFHAPYPLLPPAIRNKKMKVIFVIRNPKDTCVSQYYMYKLVDGCKYKGSIQEFATMFMDGTVTWGPFDKHVLSYWEHRNEDNILLVSYEELKKDCHACIKKIATFLGKTISEEQVEKLAQHASFDSMAKLKTVNREDVMQDFGYKDSKTEGKFMRKGIVGDWKNVFDEETNKKFDDWIRKRFENTGLTFVYE